MNRATLMAILLSSSAAMAQAGGYDEVSDRAARPHLSWSVGALELTLLGEFSLELHDIEGAGGPGRDSVTDTRTVGTRSPTVDLGEAWLALRLGLYDTLVAYTVLDMDRDGARLGAAWLESSWAGPSWLSHRVMLGLRTPIVSANRHTERYPLIASAYWRESEMQIAWEGVARPSSDWTLVLAGSAAMMRPLDLMSVLDGRVVGGTLNVIGYGPAAPFSGNAIVAGGRLGVGWNGVWLEAFGFAGLLAREAGSDVLRSALAGYGALGASGRDARAHWYGGRVGYDGYGVHVRVEAIASAEGRLHRLGGYAQAGYRIALWDGPWLRALTPLVRWERFGVRDAAQVHEGQALRSPSPTDSPAWDWSIWTAALAADVYRDLLRLRVEYAFVAEANGVPDLDVATQEVRNDELLVHLELRF